MFFEDEEFAGKNNESMEVSKLNVENDYWLIESGELKEFHDYDAEEVRVPDGVTKITAYVFAFSNSLKTIYIPKSVQILESEAIVECENLTQIYIENENIEIIEGAISDNPALKEVYIGGKKFESIIARTEDKDEPCFEKYFGDDSEFAVADGVVMINARAFEDCKSLERVYLPDSVKDISFRAFAGCVNIREFKVPQNIEFMGGQMFSGWTEYQTIYVPKTFKGIKFFQPWRRGCKAQVIYY
ncbi:MAG: leucine-rich repeat protein [Clostridiales bacterium]|nr:leucine-rich repeat protein [Clostridiales bacterium]